VVKRVNSKVVGSQESSTSSIKRTVLNNVLWLGLNEFVVHGLGLLFFIYIVRNLGETVIGQYTYMMSIAPLFYLATDLGLGTYFYRKWTVNTANFSEEYSAIIYFKLFIGLLSSLIGVVFSWFTMQALVVPFLLTLLIHFIGLFIDFNNNYFMAINKSKLKAFVIIIEKILSIIFGFTFLYLGFGLVGLLLSYTISRLISLVVQYLNGYISIKGFSHTFSLQFFSKYIKRSIPFFLTSFFFTIYYKIDNIVIKEILGYKEVGYYNIAYNVLILLNTIPQIFMYSLFPSLNSLINSDFEKFKRFFFISLKHITIIAIGLFFGIQVLANELITMMFSDVFIKSANTLKILVFSNLLLFANAQYMGLLMAQKKEKHLMLISFSAIPLNIVLDLIFIQKYSIYGVAVGTFVCELYILLLFLYFSKIVPPVFVTLIKSILCGVIMFFVIDSFSGLSIFVLVPLGVMVYYTSQLVLRNITIKEILSLKGDAGI
jgi:O-antigen/teichoic acid export membrane protein